MNNTKKLALSALLCALAVSVMYIGSQFGKIDVATALAASLCVAVGLCEYGYKNAICIYLVITFISFLLLPAKTPVVLFGAFLGYYPILKMYCEYNFSKIKAYAIKYAVLNFAVALVIIISTVFFVKLSFFIIVLFMLVINAVFPLLDMAMNMAIETYYQKIKKRK